MDGIKNAVVGLAKFMCCIIPYCSKGFGLECVSTAWYELLILMVIPFIVFKAVEQPSSMLAVGTLSTYISVLILLHFKCNARKLPQKLKESIMPTLPIVVLCVAMMIYLYFPFPGGMFLFTPAGPFFTGVASVILYALITKATTCVASK